MRCTHCRSETVTEAQGPKYFVMCKSDPCSIRKDNGERTMGRPLSDGKDTPKEAEENYRLELSKQG